MIFWDHRRICVPLLTETSLCGAYLYYVTYSLHVYHAYDSRNNYWLSRYTVSRDDCSIANGLCSLWGTNWIFIHNWDFKGLKAFTKHEKDRQGSYKGTNEARSGNHFWRAKAIIVIYSECVSVALVIHHAMGMHSVILSSVTFLALPYFSTFSHKQHDFRGGQSYCIYRYTPHNDVSVNDGPHIRRWTHNIIIPLCYNCLQYSVQ